MAYTKDYKAEELDQTPVAIPVGMKKPEPLHDMIQRLIGNKFADLRLDSDTESFEEADDFEVYDDFDPSSPWEEVFDKFGNSLGFVDQNRYQPNLIFERRLDDREKSYLADKNSVGSNGSVQGDPVSSNGERSE